jgi:hypothetical protein
MHRSRIAQALGVLLIGIAVSLPLGAQVTVNPTGVNVASQGATTVFLTFGGLGADFIAAEALWCGALVDARPDIGLRCDPATLFGRLPLRFDLARPSGTGALTDIMTIPPSVARRAYQAAAAGDRADFFYVRRFTSRSGGRDVYVAVTCRLTGGGATSPLSLVDVRLAFDVETPVLALNPGEPTPAWFADIAYTGTGRLQGRWEVVRPGEELPSDEDLLPEASLPLEQRGQQRRYTQLERFNVFLPPTGRVRLPGPDPARLPRQVDGAYLLLLRIEATDDRDSQSSLTAVAAGDGVVASGAVAGFPMPTLRYLVGSGASAPEAPVANGITLLAPNEGASPDAASSWSFVWRAVPLASRYRLEVAKADGTPVYEALIAASVAAYRPPPFLAGRVGGGELRWRVRALNAAGREVARSAWRVITLTPQ